VEIFLIMWKPPFNGERGLFKMAGTKAGGMKAAAKNLQRDPSFYAKIGAKGGKNGHTGGFAANPELARIAGAKGGRISRRRKTDAEA
jgi:general stress protein YciG